MFKWNEANEENYPPELMPVLIYVNYGEHYNIFSGHQEQGVWFTYDSFAKNKEKRKLKIFRQQKLITHWCFPILPKN